MVSEYNRWSFARSAMKKSEILRIWQWFQKCAFLPMIKFWSNFTVYSKIKKRYIFWLRFSCWSRIKCQKLEIMFRNHQLLANWWFLNIISNLWHFIRDQHKKLSRKIYRFFTKFYYGQKNTVLKSLPDAQNYTIFHS